MRARQVATAARFQAESAAAARRRGCGDSPGAGESHQQQSGHGAREEHLVHRHLGDDGVENQRQAGRKQHAERSCAGHEAERACARDSGTRRGSASAIRRAPGS